jgi:hypothetical protein
MRRLLTGSLLIAVVALVFAACDSGDDYYRDGVYADSCNQFASCGTCTPIQGCGWCTFADGTGACVAYPDECDSAQTFTWTWGPGGCRAGADASVVTGDAARGGDGSSTTPSGDSSSTTPPPSGNDASASTGEGGGG